MPTPSSLLEHHLYSTNYIVTLFSSNSFFSSHYLSLFSGPLCAYLLYALSVFSCITSYAFVMYSYRNPLFYSTHYVSYILVSHSKTVICLKWETSCRKFLLRVVFYLRYPYQPRHWPLFIIAAAKVISCTFAVGLEKYCWRYILELCSDLRTTKYIISCLKKCSFFL